MSIPWILRDLRLVPDGFESRVMRAHMLHGNVTMTMASSMRDLPLGLRLPLPEAVRIEQEPCLVAWVPGGPMIACVPMRACVAAGAAAYAPAGPGDRPISSPVGIGSALPLGAKTVGP